MSFKNFVTNVTASATTTQEQSRIKYLPRINMEYIIFLDNDDIKFVCRRNCIRRNATM